MPAAGLEIDNQVQNAQQLNQQPIVVGEDSTKRVESNAIDKTANHDIEGISKPSEEEALGFASSSEQEAPRHTRAVGKRAKRPKRRKSTKNDGGPKGGPKNCPCDICRPLECDHNGNPIRPGQYSAPQSPRVVSRRASSGSGKDSPASSSESFDSTKDYIGEILYLIDYSRIPFPGSASQVFRTTHGSEPKLSNMGFGHSPRDQHHVIVVRRKIEVNNQNRFVNPEEQPTVLVIHSHYLINALETVFVDPRSRGKLHTSPIEIKEPYESIVRHLDQLRSYKSDHSEKEDLDITATHIELLTGFITRAIGAQLESEAQMRAQEVPLTTWEWLWTNFKYGETLYTCGSDPMAYVLDSITGGVLEVDDGLTGYSYQISCWSLQFDGIYYKRKFKTFRIRRFAGSRPINSLPVYPAAFHQDTGGRSLYRELVERGKKVYNVHKESPSHMEYSGWTFDDQIREIQSRVMVDHELFWREHPLPRRVHNYNPRYSSDDSVDTAEERSVVYTPTNPYLPQPKARDDKFAGYYKIAKAAELTEHQLLLLPFKLRGWVLKDRRWSKLDIKYFSDIVPDKNIFDNLILPEDRTEIIKALVQSHKRREPVRSEVEPESPTDTPYSADPVKGKGQGLLVLLHGPPGVGKTSTAECVAEYTEKPLFPITCGDLGTESRGLEEHLQHAFGLAQRWGAVLLLDEADVFLERRELSDISRNSLVSVFLRILEYYSGILFLTTNRVGSFDEAFTSRLHVSIHYPALKETERTKIWSHHINKLERDREDVRVRENVKEYLETNTELKKIPFNGRQIRNIFQTAVSLAVYEAKTDKRLKGIPTLRSDHFKKVVNLSCEFQEYLKSTRESDSYKAKDAELRDDEFKTGRKKNNDD